MAEAHDAGAEAARVYEHMKMVFGGARPRPQRSARRAGSAAASEPFGLGRDPKGVADVMTSLTTALGWDTQLAQSELIERWIDVAGIETARHATPTDVTEGVLTVQCESTAWTTQLRLMRVELLTQIVTLFPDAGISSIRFLGPNVPSFKRGPRSVQGRGVRDTYG